MGNPLSEGLRRTWGERDRGVGREGAHSSLDGFTTETGVVAFELCGVRDSLSLFFQCIVSKTACSYAAGHHPAAATEAVTW